MKLRNINYNVTFTVEGQGNWLLNRPDVYKSFFAAVNLNAAAVELMPATLHARDVVKLLGGKKISDAWWSLPLDRLINLEVTDASQCEDPPSSYPGQYRRVGLGFKLQVRAAQPTPANT